MGLILLWDLFLLLMKGSLAPRVLDWSLFWKLGEIFWDFLFLDLKLRKDTGLEIGYVHRTCCPGSAYARLAWPTQPSLGQAREQIFNNMAPFLHMVV